MAGQRFFDFIHRRVVVLVQYSFGRHFPSRCAESAVGRHIHVADALHRAWIHSLEVASVAVIVDAADDRATAFYRRHQFQPLIETPRRLFLPLNLVRKCIT